MCYDLALRGGRLLSDGQEFSGDVYLRGDAIAAVTAERHLANQEIDLTGSWLAPGLIDLHLNGAAGLDFTAGDANALPAFEAHLLAAGVTGYLACLNTAPAEQRLDQLDLWRTVLDGRPAAAPACLGFMLEGPFYSAAQAGAHDPELFVKPSLELAAEAVDICDGWLRVWSLAPELEGSLDLIGWLRDQGVIVAIGHSSASFGEVVEAVDAGAGLMTHLYCCLDSFSGAGPDKRLGANEAGLCLPGLVVEAICDNRHLTPELQAWVTGQVGWERVCTVTDAMAATGLGDGRYQFLGGEVEVVDGEAWRPDRTHYAGSTATLPGCLANLLTNTGLSRAEAVGTMTTVPARLLGCWPERGSLRPGSRADLVQLDASGEVLAVWVGGQEA